MTSHTVTVKVDDPKRLDAIIKALNEAGYTVGTPRALEPEKKS